MPSFFMAPLYNSLSKIRKNITRAPISLTYYIKKRALKLFRTLFLMYLLSIQILCNYIVPLFNKRPYKILLNQLITQRETLKSGYFQIFVILSQIIFYRNFSVFNKCLVHQGNFPVPFIKRPLGNFV